jgi:energy-coupling factor transporter ATP-binding protein EcfA2
MFKLKSIKIVGLFGKKTYEIKVENNKLILVAENGSGKTTIVNIMYYFLSRQWAKLLKYDFKEIIANINGQEIYFSRDWIDLSKSDKISRYMKKYPPHYRDMLNRILPLIETRDLFRHPENIERIANLYDVPSGLLFDFFNSFRREQENLFTGKLSEIDALVSKLFDAKILYLPTYRRIEQELQSIFPGLEEDIVKYQRKNRLPYKQDSHYVELVEFGMEDVVNVIEQKVTSLKDNFNFNLQNTLTGGYLKSVINKDYQKLKYDLIQEFNENRFKSILNRIDESILTNNEKERLLNFIKEIKLKSDIEAEDKILAYFLYRLLDIYKTLENEESAIVKFKEVCNRYLANKTLNYDNFQMSINLESGDEIKFRDLSSGEKQIISLFSQLYLTEDNQYFIIIDEPELSLSVPWQRKFLTDICESNYCSGIIAVTHSPFIFENELNRFAHSLNEFDIR